jgi:hypothetical protein
MDCFVNQKLKFTQRTAHVRQAGEQTEPKPILIRATSSTIAHDHEESKYSAVGANMRFVP